MSDAERRDEDKDKGKHRRTIPEGKATIIGASIGGIAAIIAAIIGVIALLGSGGPSDVTNNAAPNGPSACNGAHVSGSHNNFNCAPTVVSTASGAGLSKDLQARIVQLTGSYTEQGFTTQIFDRNTSTVALYLKSGMNAANLYQGTSAILFGFEELDQNGDPIQSGGAVALVKTFQAAGFKVNEDLQDSYLMGQLTGGLWPGMFDTPLTPKGYTGGYQDGTFIGSLLFWIVQRALGWGPTAEDIQVIHYLVGQGADCNVPLSFLKYAISTGQLSADEAHGLLPIMESCAK